MVVQEQMKKKNLEKSRNNKFWKKENLIILRNRMSETQLKTFNQSYNEKIEFGKMVYSKN